MDKVISRPEFLKPGDTIEVGYSGPMEIEEIRILPTGDYRLLCYRLHGHAVFYTLATTAAITLHR
jgi:hypothetical protein